MTTTHIRTKQQLEAYITKLREMTIGEYGIVAEIKTGTRTPPQNRSLHLYCTHVAEACNAAGLDMRKVLKPEVEIPWTSSSVKEYMWRPIQKVMTGKESTTKLDRAEPSAIYEVMHRHLAGNHGIMVLWPCRDSLMDAA